MEDTEKKEQKRRLHRSPGYPMISLEEAIQKVKILWDKDKKNPIPKEAFYRHLNYKVGGYGGRVLAAMKKYGLITEKKNDIILTQDAVNLAIYEQTDNEYIETLKKTALNPKLYEKLYEQYNGNIPSDTSFKVKLINEYGFNPNSIDNFINNFKSTIEYAGLSEETEETIKSDDMVERDIAQMRAKQQMKEQYAGTSLSVREKEQPRQVPVGLDAILSKEGTQYNPILLSKGKKAVLVFESLPIEKKDIERIKKWLDLFADSLTETETEEEKPS